MAFQAGSHRDVTARTEAFEPAITLGISRALWRSRIPVDNPLTQAKVSLGETLYFDKRLSINGTVSCATCHDPANSFTDRRALALGVSDKLGTLKCTNPQSTSSGMCWLVAGAQLTQRPFDYANV